MNCRCRGKYANCFKWNNTWAQRDSCFQFVLTSTTSSSIHSKWLYFKLKSHHFVGFILLPFYCRTKAHEKNRRKRFKLPYNRSANWRFKLMMIGRFSMVRSKMINKFTIFFRFLALKLLMFCEGFLFDTLSMCYFVSKCQVKQVSITPIFFLPFFIYFFFSVHFEVCFIFVIAFLCNFILCEKHVCSLSERCLWNAFFSLENLLTMQL